MRLLNLFLWSLLTITPGAEASEEGWAMESLGDGLYTLAFDSTSTKSTIVEFSDAIYLLEVSLSDEGGGARVLVEHREGGEAILRILEARFPDKPLAAVLHSHWHPHSLSSVAPFLEQGIPLVTTAANFERIEEFVDPSLLEASRNLIRFVTAESMTLGSGDETIVARRVTKEDLPSLPTPDYLFFELPARRALHTGCMYSIWRGEPAAGREVVPRRALDLHGYLQASDFEVDGLVRLYAEEEGAQIHPISRLQKAVETGITAAELSARFEGLSAADLRQQRDQLLRDTIEDNVPASILNSLVYRNLGDQELELARELALLQALVAPSNPNAWDTLGEVHYFLGEPEVARAYERHSRAIDPGFTGWGEEVWAENLRAYQERWAETESGS